MAKRLPKKVKEVLNNQPETSKEDTIISYSAVSTYHNCPRQWEVKHLRRLLQKPSIHTLFGTAIHETIQHWLKVMYEESAKAADKLDLNRYLYDTLIRVYQKDLERNNEEHYTTGDELEMYYLQGTYILDYLKKKRGMYFSKKKTFLAGIETKLYKEIKQGVYFKGYIDLVFYNEAIDKWTIIDIKTSTSGWKSFQKKDPTKTGQVILYKKFFSEQFDIPIDKIEVLFFIVKRVVPKEADFAVMQRRVQEFKPASGKIKVGQALNLMNSFIEGVTDDNGNIIDKEYPTTPGKWACRFCELANTQYCNDVYYEFKK